MKTIVFDLDGTLTESKESLDNEMVSLIKKLLDTHNVVIVSGASWKQLQKQVLNRLHVDTALLNRLYFLPTSGSSMYQMWGKYGWIEIYGHKFPHKDSARIIQAFEDVLKETKFSPKKIWGKQIEDRESQITFSALGQNAPVEDKEKFDPDFSKRKSIVDSLHKKIFGYEIQISGTTSIDVTLKGINKRYGVDELMKRLHLSKDDVIYVGDSVFKGGDDFAAIELGLEYVQVKNPDETKKWIAGIVQNSANATGLEKVG